MEKAFERDRRLPPGRIPRLLLPSLLLVAAACGARDDTPARGAAAQRMAAAEPADAENAPEPSAVIQVVMVDYLIDMPETLPAGRATFRVSNQGFEEHNFEVERDGENVFRFRRPLNPGAVNTTELELEPGVYTIACTLAGHDGRGMLRSLIVTADAEPPSPG